MLSYVRRGPTKRRTLVPESPRRIPSRRPQRFSFFCLLTFWTLVVVCGITQVFLSGTISGILRAFSRLYDDVDHFQYRLTEEIEEEALPSLSSTDRTALPTQKPLNVNFVRGAICLVGAARDFELTGPSIKKHLLGSYRNADVFVNMALDDKSYKLTLLSDISNLARVRLFAQSPIEEGNATTVLAAHGSPNGIQGLLQYFDLVEGCLDLIDDYSSNHSVTYRWIIRTRVDTFWTGPPPHFFLEKGIYVVPEGSRFGGLNDRFGFGSFEESRVALRRLTMLEALYNAGRKGLNSEQAFAGQLDVSGIKVLSEKFNFCVVSRRLYSWSTKAANFGVPVIALSSLGPMNGAKCRPCTPITNASESEEILQSFSRSWGWPGDNPELELCNATEPWEKTWRAVFDRVAGQDIAAERKRIVRQTRLSCVKKFNMLQSIPGGYEGPPGSVVCQLRKWGSFEILKYAAVAQVPVFLPPLDKSSIVYSLEFSKDLELEALIHQRTRSSIHLFQSHSPRLTLYQQMLAYFNGITTHQWVVGEKNGGVKSSLLSSSLTKEGFRPKIALKVGPSEVDSKALKSTMADLGHNSVDLLMLAVSEATLPGIIGRFFTWDSKIPICQLILRLEPVIEGATRKSFVNRVREVFRTVGFFMIHCKGKYSEEFCLFLRGDPCKK